MPKIIGGSLHEHREQTRLKLFAALSELMTERGFDAITLADIAAAAGIGRTAVYNHFADKEAMLLGFIMHETEQYVVALEQELDGIEDPTQKLRTYIRAQSRLKRDYHMVSGADLRSVLSRGTQQRVREHVVMLEQVLRRILAAGIDSGDFPPQDLATTVALVNACLTRTLPNQEPARGEAIESTVTFVLRAVGADPEPAQAPQPADHDPVPAVA
ncbi:TetR/AcrR family transcriptional regulator [Cellulomonas denverensis]|uniref:TetR/AcrR family transcriptional regulator n=1 Tax=Cellulomonas denverensis TaxID=264297 RepID=A0A7X6KWA1_9CELL|nr:TetR/AcrR family transcriptional regulator [Cellulomonas denverensis]NKY23406.1 TetR/AcrR family transcriptional regulator [Cellulomonas denverensis]GIG25113.1 putative regulatory protein, TetR [Cellulomonas denverensis]